MKILDALAAMKQGQGTSEIARLTNMNKATVFKLLETLQLIGFVEKSTPDSRYKLGPGLIRFAYNSLQQLDIVSLSAPYLEQLNKDTNETIHLAVLNEQSLIYVAKLESTQAVRTVSRIGRQTPLYCTGMGKAMLSTFSDEKLAQYVATTTFLKNTPTTITDKIQFMAEINKIRVAGYAFDDGENEEDIRCIAVPLTVNTRLLGAISLSAPKYRIDDAAIHRYLPLFFDAKRNIEERLRLS